MISPRVLVLRAPGTNCDVETAFAFERAGAKPDRVHVNRLVERPELLDDYQILCIPGGFSYGDDIAAGRILGGLFKQHLAETMSRFKSRDTLMLGICNGFQVLMRTGMLLEDSAAGPVATLAANESGRYEDRWVTLRVDKSPCVFFRGIDTLELPVAHGEGRFVARDAALIQQLESQGQLVLRYAGQNGSSDVPYPANPNGAMAHVAGVCDATGRVCGLMPHPERFIDFVQHPQWTRLPKRDSGDGLRIFENAVRYFN